jgi:hypothetical protein
MCDGDHDGNLLIGYAKVLVMVVGILSFHVLDKYIALEEYHGDV